jgi:glycine/D-amino acid oxidase-like deaminating enzyme
MTIGWFYKISGKTESKGVTHNFIIIGAGVAGRAVALELANRGAQINLIDRGGLGQESSWAEELFTAS